MKNAASIIAVSLAVFATASAASWDLPSASWSELSKMGAKELLEFYKKNPDFWKKRVGLDYGRYQEGDWVVLRGEYLSSGSGAGIPWVPVFFSVNGKQYVTVTGNGGIFNLEVPKTEFRETGTYSIETSIDGIRAAATYGGKKLLDDSVYHFRVWRTAVGSPVPAGQETLHNEFYRISDWKLNRKEVSVPSAVGIQGFPAVIFMLFLAVLLGFSYHRRQKAVADDVIAEAGREAG